MQKSVSRSRTNLKIPQRGLDHNSGATTLNSALPPDVRRGFAAPLKLPKGSPRGEAAHKVFKYIIRRGKATPHIGRQSRYENFVKHTRSYAIATQTAQDIRGRQQASGLLLTAF